MGLRKHLYQNIEKYDTYQSVRNQIASYLESRRYDVILEDKDEPLKQSVDSLQVEVCVNLPLSLIHI